MLQLQQLRKYYSLTFHKGIIDLIKVMLEDLKVIVVVVTVVVVVIIYYHYHYYHYYDYKVTDFTPSYTHIYIIWDIQQFE